VLLTVAHPQLLVSATPTVTHPYHCYATYSRTVSFGHLYYAEVLAFWCVDLYAAECVVCDVEAVGVGRDGDGDGL